MRRARVYPGVVAAVAVALAACGGTERPTLAPPAEPRTFELGWVERTSARGFVFRVERLTVTSTGWSADVAVENRTGLDYMLQRSHRPRESMFGIVLLETASRAELRRLTSDFQKTPPFLEPERIDPPPPVSFRAGRRWRGRMIGSTVLPRGAVARLLFGRFTRLGRIDEPEYVIWVTDHHVRL
jgi:hypothetical protein